MLVFLFSIWAILNSQNVSCLDYYAGRVYAGTLGDGLYIIETKDFLVRKFSDSVVTCPYITELEASERGLLVGTYNGLYCIDGEGHLLYSYVSDDYYDRFVTSIGYFRSFSVVGTSSGISIIRDGIVVKRPFYSPVSCVSVAGDSVLIGSIEGLFVMEQDLTVRKIPVPVENFPVSCVFADSGWIWIGLEDAYEDYSPGGLYLFGGGSLFWRIDVISAMKYYGVSDICKVDDSLLISVYKMLDGLKLGYNTVLFHGVVSRLSLDEDQTPLNVAVNDILFIPERNEIWLATVKGIEIIGLD
ncbi:hypothetical protein JXA84_09060 [candidate division WOR-3 bacterium]|nr:hypothetical protein [candidate division WOR-3 bacterium]